MSEQNPFSLVSTLNAVFEQIDDETFMINVTLDLGRDEIPVDEDVFEIRISRAFIFSGLSGLTPVQGTRFGVQKMTEKVKRKQSNESTRSGGAGASVSTSGLAVSLSTGLRGMGSQKKSRSTSHSDERSAVLARGGGAWEIRDVGGEGYLEGTFLEDEALIVLKKSVGANLHQATLDVRVKRRDVKFSLLEKGAQKSVGRKVFGVNKEKLLSIFAAKCLSAEAIGEVSQTGTIILSQVEMELKDEN